MKIVEDIFGRKLSSRAICDRQKQRLKTTKVFQNLKSGKDTGIISRLVIIECVHALGRKQFEKHVKENRSGERAFFEIKKRRKEFLEYTLNLDNVRIDECTAIRFSDSLQESYKLIMSYAGYKYINNRMVKSAGPLDLMHIVIAKYLRCDQFATLDGDFNAYKNHEMLGV